MHPIATARQSRAGRAITVLLIVIGLAVASGCTPASLVVGAGSRVGLAAFEDRGIGGTVSDSALQLSVNRAMIDASGDLFWPISTLVREGRVLMVGNVPTADDRAEAVRLAEAVDGVVSVIDQLEVGPRSVLFDDAQDTIISRRLESELLFDSEIRSVNYGILTHNAVVYLMGVARSQWELDRVVAHARNVSYVRGVTSHVRVLNQETASRSSE